MIRTSSFALSFSEKNAASLSKDVPNTFSGDVIDLVIPNTPLHLLDYDKALFIEKYFKQLDFISIGYFVDLNRRYDFILSYEHSRCFSVRRALSAYMSDRYKIKIMERGESSVVPVNKLLKMPLHKEGFKERKKDMSGVFDI